MNINFAGEKLPVINGLLWSDGKQEKISVRQHQVSYGIGGEREFSMSGVLGSETPKLKLSIPPAAPQPILDAISAHKKQILFMYRKMREVLEPIGVRVGICGGAIRDVFGFGCYLPKDVDVFFLIDRPILNLVLDPKQEIQKALELAKIIRYDCFDPHNAKEKPISMHTNRSFAKTAYPENMMPFVNGAYFAFENFKDEMTSKPPLDEIPMQFMLRYTDVIPDFFALLNNFDWNICKLGVFDGNFYDLCDDYHHLKLNINRVNEQDGNDAEISLRRGMNFSFRYDIQIEPESLAALCGAISSGFAEKNKDKSEEDAVWGNF